MENRKIRYLYQSIIIDLTRIDKGREVYALSLTEYMEHEREYLPWHTLVRNLDFTLSLMSQTDFWDEFRVSFIKIVLKSFQKESENT